MAIEISFKQVVVEDQNLDEIGHKGVLVLRDIGAVSVVHRKRLKRSPRRRNRMTASAHRLSGQLTSAFNANMSLVQSIDVLLQPDVCCRWQYRPLKVPAPLTLLNEARLLNQTPPIVMVMVRAPRHTHSRV